MKESETTTTLPLTMPEPEVEKSNPWADDKLGVETFAKSLTEIVVSQSHPLTLAVNGIWGSGKTFLLKRWHQDLRNQGFPSVYFSAWEDDDQTDPLLSLLWRLVHVNDSEDKNGIGVLGQPEVRTVIEQACSYLRFGNVLSPANLASTVSSLVVASLPTALSGQSWFGNQVYKFCLWLLKRSNPIDEFFSEYSSRSRTRRKLSEEFRKLIASISIKNGAIQHRPVVVIIDELDRCRPTYAIEMLERIKHLFALENTVFVLGIDRAQLGHSIQAVYGNIEVTQYLHRFFDLELALPVEKTSMFIENLWKRFGISSYVQLNRPEYVERDREKNDDAEFMELIKTLAQIHRMSLRELERFVSYYALVLREKTGNERYRYPLALVLIFLKLRASDLYFALVQGTASLVDVADRMIPEVPNSPEYPVVSILGIVYAIFKHHCGSREDQAAVGNYVTFVAGKDGWSGERHSESDGENGLEKWEAKCLRQLETSTSDFAVAVTNAEQMIVERDGERITRNVPQCIRAVAHSIDLIDRS